MMPITNNNKPHRLLSKYLHKAFRFVQVYAEQSVFNHHLTNSKGSSALIVIYKVGLSQFMMQQIASHTHHSATVFLNAAEISNYSCRIRWFNQHKEINRCGHGTLAAAVYLNRVQGKTPHLFYSRTKETFKIHTHRNTLQLELKIINSEKITPHHAIESAIDVPILKSYSTSKKGGYTAVLINSQQPLNSLKVQVDKLQNYPNAVILLQQNLHNGSFSFRYFAPYYGIDEDKATGSALSVLAPLINHLTKSHKGTLFQASTNGAIIHYYLKKQSVTLY